MLPMEIRRTCDAKTSESKTKDPRQVSSPHSYLWSVRLASYHSRLTSLSLASLFLESRLRGGGMYSVPIPIAGK